VKDISLDLNKLKEEIKTKNPNKTQEELNQIKNNINGQESTTSREDFTSLMDNDIEKIFDDYVVQHKEEIKNLLLAGDHTGLENMFNTQILNPANIIWARNKKVLDAYNLTDFKFELKAAKQDVVNMINGEDNITRTVPTEE
jgi:hypothetical protein